MAAVCKAYRAARTTNATFESVKPLPNETIIRWPPS